MGLTAGAIKVVTDRKVSYIYGRLTEAEASKAVDVARGVQGVVKVVRVVEVITADELKAILGK
jgi:osmotically-inducible protein OsmY